MKTIIAAVAVAGLMVAGNVMAGDDPLAKCNTCHKTGVGPAYKDIQAAYGSAGDLEKAMSGGLKQADRKVAQAKDSKWKSKMSTMDSQVALFKGKEKETAAAIFAAK